MSTKNYDEKDAVHLLKGAIDTHIHHGPDIVPRKFDALELARDSAKAGMRAIIIKCHVSPTEGRAYLVQKIVPEVKVFGGICLNANVGGLNPEALQMSARMGAKIVWMPTVSAENHIKCPGLPEALKAIEGGMKREGITILDGKGKLKKEVFEILEIVKEHNIILATGHLSLKESLILIEEALRRGVKKILFTHPGGFLTPCPLEEQKRLAPRGVFFERCWLQTTNTGGEKWRILPEDLANAIKSIGPESTVMATDHGQKPNQAPSEAMREYIATMLRLGISPKEIELMTQQNPAQLLDI